MKNDVKIHERETSGLYAIYIRGNNLGCVSEDMSDQALKKSKIISSVLALKTLKILLSETTI